MKISFLATALFLLVGLLCAQNPLETIVRDNKSAFGPWASDPETYEVQVLYTEIDRRDDGTVQLTTHRWGVADTNQYFYPASTVKLPAAILALQRINEIGATGLSPLTPLFHGTGTAPASAPQTSVRYDLTVATGQPSVQQYIDKIFLVSDNDAYNRLFEWLGPTYLNQGLHRVGIQGGRLQHRVGVKGYDAESHAWLNPVKFVDGINVPLQLGERHDLYYDSLPAVTEQQRGDGYITNGGELIREPFDFSHKNYLSVTNLHDVLLRVVLPEAVAPEQRFQLTSTDYRSLRRAMSQRPRESNNYRSTRPDNYVKFWIYGDQPPKTRIPDAVRIYNKIGMAYGYLTDAAYLTDAESGAEFLLVGTIHVNKNRIFNDGVYEYETIGLPFFGELGRAVLDYERRKKKD